MNLGDEVEIEKSDDPNHGRAGRIARMPSPQAIDVAFEDGMERATYRPEELRPVAPRIPRGMPSRERGPVEQWADLWNISALVSETLLGLWNIPALISETLLGYQDGPPVAAVVRREWSDGTVSYARYWATATGRYEETSTEPPEELDRIVSR